MSFRPAYYVSQLVYYELNIDYIIENYCVNKSRPRLQCNGKCHLMKQLNVVDLINTSNEKSIERVVINAFYPVFAQNNTFEFSKELFPNLNTKVVDIYNNSYTYLLVSKQNKPPSFFLA